MIQNLIKRFIGIGLILFTLVPTLSQATQTKKESTNKKQHNNEAYIHTVKEETKRYENLFKKDFSKEKIKKTCPLAKKNDHFDCLVKKVKEQTKNNPPNEAGIVTFITGGMGVILRDRQSEIEKIGLEQTQKNPELIVKYSLNLAEWSLFGIENLIQLKKKIPKAKNEKNLVTQEVRFITIDKAIENTLKISKNIFNKLKKHGTEKIRSPASKNNENAIRLQQLKEKFDELKKSIPRKKSTTAQKIELKRKYVKIKQKQHS